MSVILRTVKGSALTYDELDRNFSQFIYSSSVVNNGATLRFFYTGSTSLDTVSETYSPRFEDISFPSNDITIPDPVAAGSDKQVQFRQNGTFAADSGLIYDSIGSKLGIGGGTVSLSDRVEVSGDAGYGARISLKASTSTATSVGDGRKAEITFNHGNTRIGRIGKTVENDSTNLYFTNITADSPSGAYGKIHISFQTQNGLDSNGIVGTFYKKNNQPFFGVGTNNPTRQASIVGSEGIGISLSSNTSLESFLKPIPSSIYNAIDATGATSLIPNSSTTAGLLISSPTQADGGNIVMAINTDTGDSNEAFNIINANEGSYSNSEVIASFAANKKHGLNTNTASDIGLTVAGVISGSGTLQIGTIATATADNTSALVATSTGLVQKIAASPVPIGGIIMWSGAVANIPSGWSLCNGSNNTPNLQDKFVVGAGSTYNPTDNGGSADAVLVTHSHTANVNDPGHKHTAGAADGNVNNQPSSPFQKTEDGRENVIETDTATTGVSVAITTEGVSGVNKNLPPYFALAYIMYIGA